MRPGLVAVPLKPGPVPPGPAAGRLADAAEPKTTFVPAPASASMGDAAEPKTTLMLRNLGAETTTEMLMEELRLFGMDCRVDYVHAWVDFKSKSRTGHAYLNFLDPTDARFLKERWQGREEFGGIPCRHRWQRASLSVVFARKQGFDLCVVESRRKHMKDPSMTGWVHPSKEALVTELVTGLSPPPGLAAPLCLRRLFV